MDNDRADGILVHGVRCRELIARMMEKMGKVTGSMWISLQLGICEQGWHGFGGPWVVTERSPMEWGGSAG